MLGWRSVSSRNAVAKSLFSAHCSHPGMGRREQIASAMVLQMLRKMPKCATHRHLESVSCSCSCLFQRRLMYQASLLRNTQAQPETPRVAIASGNLACQTCKPPSPGQLAQSITIPQSMPQYHNEKGLLGNYRKRSWGSGLWQE